MVAHIYALNIIQVLRSLCGLGVAGLFLYFSDPANVPRNNKDVNLSRFHELEPWEDYSDADSDPALPFLATKDTTAFFFVGCGLGLIAAVRLAHAGFILLALVAHFRGALLVFSRYVGFAFAFFDLVDLTFFPVTTACGLYAVLVYRHADTIDLFAGRFSPTGSRTA